LLRSRGLHAVVEQPLLRPVNLRLGAKNMKFGYPMAKTLGNCCRAILPADFFSSVPAGSKTLIHGQVDGAEEGYAAGLINEIVMTRRRFYLTLAHSPSGSFERSVDSLGG